MADNDQLDPLRHPWLNDPALRRILDAVRAGGGEARIVGGAVRDALLGRAVGEIDLAVNLPPEKVSGLLTRAGLKVVPTGIAHGTITAVADHRGFEITTLRRDVETDGRRAKVAFTDDWQADAARRDFTINALYADAKGRIYDYFDGRKDIAEGRVRFIGDARARIAEDVLRILRFFRFAAWFGKGGLDAESLAACREQAKLLPKLSAERIAKEILKLLAAPDPAPIWQAMIEDGILKHILPEATNVTRLSALQVIERRYGSEPAPLTRFAALLPEDAGIADGIARRLKLSNRDADALLRCAILPAQLKGKLDPVPLRRALYRYGAGAARQGALLLAAAVPGLDITTALETIEAWGQPAFPLQGADLLKLGMPEGPRIGMILSAVETWWIAHDFRPGGAECLAEAKRQAPTPAHGDED